MTFQSRPAGYIWFQMIARFLESVDIKCMSFGSQHRAITLALFWLKRKTSSISSSLFVVKGYQSYLWSLSFRTFSTSPENESQTMTEPSAEPAQTYLCSMSPLNMARDQSVDILKFSCLFGRKDTMNRSDGSVVDGSVTWSYAYSLRTLSILISILLSMFSSLMLASRVILSWEIWEI